MDNIKLKWNNTTEDMIESLSTLVISDIAYRLQDLKTPSNLAFHTVFVDKSYDGPIVSVWGEKNDDEFFYCEYDPKSVWKKIQD